MGPTPHVPRAAAALAAAALLAVAGAPGTPSAAADGPSRPVRVAPAEAGDGEGPSQDAVGRAEGRVAALVRRAAAAAETVRRAEAAVSAERRRGAVLAGRAAAHRRRYDALRRTAGLLARAQYQQAYLPPVVELLLARDPEARLRSEPDARNAEVSVAGTLRELQRGRRQLARDRRESAASRVRLAAAARRSGTARREVDRRLGAARRVLTARKAAAGRSAASADAAGGPSRAPACGGRDESAGGPPPAPRHPRAGGWALPVDHYTLSAGFNRPGAHWKHRHSGQDFAVPVGTAVHAAGSGTVVAAGCGGAYGLNVVVRHRGGWYTQYGHLSAVQVRPGERVVTGQQIGKSGSTGNSTGPHLHFEVRVTPFYGSAVEPLSWLREHGVRVPDHR